LRPAQLRGLQFELQLGDLLAQRLQAAFEGQALLVGALQLRAQVVVGAARQAQGLLAFELDGQRTLQPALRRGVVEAAARGE
jgi:hypothetical protein